MTTLGNQRASRLTLSVLYYGQACAAVILESGELPSGKLTLSVGSLSLVASVLRANFDGPDLPHAVLESGIGWSGPVTRALSYQSDAGVRLATVLTDLVAMAGESVEASTLLAPNAILGQHYAVPMGGTIRDALTALVGRAWRVDFDGVTRFGARPPPPAHGRATVMRRDASVGLLVVGCDDPAGLMPGAVVEGFTVRRAVVVEAAKKLEVECWV